jgi:nuclear transport factor 2 (NTF2) superfamily protein
MIIEYIVYEQTSSQIIPSTRFLKQKWVKEQHYRLKKELFAFGDDKIAVQFWYEYCPDPQSAPEKWKRCECFSQ